MAQGAQAGVPVPRDLQTAVARFIETHGVLEAARRLRLARETLIRLRTGDMVREGTIEIVRQRLREAT